MLTQRKTAVFDNRDIIFMLLFLMGSIAAVNFSFFGGFNLGFAISYLFFAILSLFYISFQSFRCTGLFLFCLLCAVLLALSFCLHANMLMKWISFCAIIVLTAIFLSLSTGTAKYGAGSYLFFVDLLKTVFVVPTVFIGKTFEGFLQKCRKKKDKKFGSGVLVGVLLAIPVLLIIVPLLASADDAFRGFLSYVAVDFSGEGIISLVFGFTLFLFLFSMAFAYRKRLARQQTTQRTGVLWKRHDANPAMINTFLALISFVYVVYLFSQLAYFVNAFSGILPPNYSLSEYARSGFFEMAFLCAVNFLLLFMTLFFTKYKDGKRLLSTRLLATFICVFSLFLCCSVFAKLCMYIDRYGMTPLRVYTMLFTLFLTLLFLLAMVRLYVVRIPYIKIATVSAAVLCVVAALGDIDGVIARYNESAYRSGSIEELDVALLGDLSDAAVPVLVRLLDDSDQKLAQSAAEILVQKAEKYFVVQDKNFVIKKERQEDFRSYNRVNQQAKALILANWQKIQEQLS